MSVRNSAAIARARSYRRNLLVGTAAAALLALPAHANPLGGTVTTGSASISTPSKSATSIKQTSEGVVINWSSFNISGGQTTTFVQPNAQAIAVNRIGSASASQILGTLDANGRVVIINGNGLLFGKNAKVNVGSLIATSTDGSDSDVLGGKFSNAGNQNASIVNRGAITAASHGTVALVAPNVSNKGIVEAKLGTVSLGGANAFTVDFKGDGLVSFAAQGDVNGAASVVNTGKLVGANIAITAHAAEGVATGVVSTSGAIVAKGVHASGGTILLDAGNGSLTTGGRIDAGGKTGGGAIETSGNAVSIGGKITAGLGGNWKVDPTDLTIDSTAASTINAALSGGTNVTEQTTSTTPSGGSIGNTSTGLGDINVDSALSWNTSALLTLDAYHSLNINAPISITGAGQLALQYNDAATTGTMNFDLGSSGFGGSVSYGATNNGGTLSVNGNAYTLLYTAANLQGVNSALGGKYALADSLNLTSVTWTPIGTSATPFSGTFEGLGNTVSNLTIASAANYLGLFGAASGTLRDIGVVTGSITGTSASSEDGLLAGYISSNGSVYDAYATGSSSGGGLVGGLIGEVQLNGTSYAVVNSYTAVTVASSGSAVGGLIGGVINGGDLASGSYATGTVTGTNSNFVGGLVGHSEGTITNSYATGNVSDSGTGQYIGGLVGYAQGNVTNSYATGTVTGYKFVGGLVGVANSAITSSYATGQVTALSGGSDIGGFIGEAFSSTVSDDYSTGAVIGNNAGGPAGFVGAAIEASLLDNFSTGAVSGTNGPSGFLGTSSVPETYSDNYWDTQTSGQSSSAIGTPMTTAQLKAALPAGFTSTYWSIVPTVTFPLLNSQYTSVYGTVSSSGGAAKNGDTVALLVNGASVTPLSSGTGAGGLYYELLAPGAIASGSDVTAYLTAGYTKPGDAVLEDASGSIANLNIEEGVLQVTTDKTTASATLAGLDTAIGANTGSQFLYTQAGGFASGDDVFITGTSSFDIDTAVNATSDYLKITSKGLLTESAGSIDANELALNAAGGITLGGANDFNILKGTTTGATGDIDINDTAALKVDGHIDAGYGAGSLTLSSGGTITQVTSTVMDAGSFGGSSVGNATFNGANVIASLGNFTNAGSGNFSLNDTSNLSLTGTLSVGHQASLTSSGTISETGTGIIDTTSLVGSSVGGTTLDNAGNDIAEIGAFTNTGAGGFTFDNSVRLTIKGPVSGGTGDVDITALTGNLVSTADISGADVTLSSSTGNFTQNSGSITTAGVLTVNAQRNITMDNLNTYSSESLNATTGTVTGN